MYFPDSRFSSAASGVIYTQKNLNIFKVKGEVNRAIMYVRVGHINYSYQACRRPAGATNGPRDHYFLGWGGREGSREGTKGYF